MVKKFSVLKQIVSMVIKIAQGNGNIQVIGDIVGARWSGKTKAEEKIALMLLRVAKQLGLKINIVIARYEVSGANETFDEILDLVDEYDITNINRTRRTLEVGGNQLRVIGLKSNTSKKVAKLGIKRVDDLDIQLLIVDEIFEFKEANELQAVREAIGGAKNTIELRSTNPFSIFHWYIAGLADKIKIDPNQMDEKGYMFQDKWSFNPESKVKTYEFIHWSNHRINEFLTPTQHQQLIDLWKTDPLRARVVERGEMGMEKGGIYTPYLDKVPTEIPSTYIPHRFIGASDSGITRDATTYLLMSHNRDKTQWAIHGEYYHSHEEQKFFLNGIEQPFIPKTITQYAMDGVKFFQQWKDALKLPLDLQMDMYGDNTSALYQAVDDYAKLMGSHWLNGLPSYKPPILMRIDAEHFLMSRGNFFIDGKRCPTLLKELHMASWEEDIAKKQANSKTPRITRLDGADHCINAMEYGIGDSIWDILEHPDAELYKRGKYA